MKNENKLSWHIGRTVLLGAPVVVAQILQMLIGVTDSLMVAQLGELPLAQITLGTQFNFFFIIIAVGLSIPVNLIAAPALAQNDETAIRRAARMGLWQAAIFFVVVFPALNYSREVLEFLGQDPAVVEGAGRYIDISLWAMPFIFLGNVLRNYLLALERNVILMGISIIGVLVNILGNYILIFGHFGAPRLGLEGAAWATLFTNGAMFFATLLFVLREPLTRKIALFGNFFRADWAMFWEMLRLGVPTAAGLLSEVGLFQMSGLLMGLIGVSELAAFGLVLQIASLAFMIPLGFSIVASVRAGQALGRKDFHAVRMVAWATLCVVSVVMLVTASLFWFLPMEIIAFFIDENDPANAELVRLSAVYLGYVAIFQIVDGAQVVGISVLRGLKDVFIPAVLAFIAYWGVGVTGEYLFAFRLHWGGEGIWVGLVIGLAAAALLLWGRFFQTLRRLENNDIGAKP